MKMTLQEMKVERDKLNKEIKELEEKELLGRQRVVSNKIASMTDEEKQFILGHMEHGRMSCSDENPCNGYYDDEHKWRCIKCMLMEILNGEHGGRFDFKISADILEV